MLTNASGMMKVTDQDEEARPNVRLPHLYMRRISRLDMLLFGTRACVRGNNRYR